MKKLLLIPVFFLFIVILCEAQTGITDTKKKKQEQILQEKKDKENVIVDSVLYGRQEIQIDTAFKNLIARTIKESGKKDEWDIANFILQCIVFFVGGWAAYSAWKSLEATKKSLAKTQDTLNRDKKYKDLSFIGEVDKLLIEHPELWAYEDSKTHLYLKPIIVKAPEIIIIEQIEKIKFRGLYYCLISPYDKAEVQIDSLVRENVFDAQAGNSQIKLVQQHQKISISHLEVLDGNNNVNAEIIIDGKSELNVMAGTVILQSVEDKILSDRIDAFCYYKLNNFELALKDHTDKSALTAWENYLVYLYINSTAFKNIVKRIFENKDYGKIYNQDFLAKIKKILYENGHII